MGPSGEGHLEALNSGPFHDITVILIWTACAKTESREAGRSFQDLTVWCAQVQVFAEDQTVVSSQQSSKEGGGGRERAYLMKKVFLWSSLKSSCDKYIADKTSRPRSWHKQKHQEHQPFKRKVILTMFWNSRGFGANWSSAENSSRKENKQHSGLMWGTYCNPERGENSAKSSVPTDSLQL